jgi:hypothetical protein
LLLALSLLGGCQQGESPVTREQELAAKAAANDASLLAALEQIAAFHAQEQTGLVLNPPVPDYPGLAEEFPCRLSQEMETLWGWRNGEKTDRFVWYHRFLPMEEALRQYRLLRANPLVAWHPSWIPVFRFEGEWYATVCADSASAAAPVIHYFIEDGAQVAYINLATWMTTMAEALDAGALTWQDGWWREDIKRLAAIHAQENPGVPFPYYLGE